MKKVLLMILLLSTALTACTATNFVVGYALESPHKKTYKKKFTNGFSGNQLKWMKVYTRDEVIETQSMIQFVIQTKDDSLYSLAGQEVMIESEEGSDRVYITSAGYDENGSFIGDNQGSEWYLGDIEELEFSYFTYPDDENGERGFQENWVHIQGNNINALFLGFRGTFPGIESPRKELIPIEEVEKVVFKTHTIGTGTSMLMGVGLATDLIVGTIWLITLAF